MRAARDHRDEPKGDALAKVTRAAFALMTLEARLAEAAKAGDMAATDALCGELERIRTVVHLIRLLAGPNPARPH